MSEIKRTTGVGEASRTERGVAAAHRGIVAGKNWTTLVAELQSDFGVSRATAARWHRAARDQEIRASTNLDPSDTESIRWDTIARWAKLRIRCEAEAQTQLDHPKGSERIKRRALAWLQQAMQYDKATAKLLHHDLIPPDRDLTQPEIMAQTIAALLRHLGNAPRDQLRILRDQIDILLSTCAVDNSAQALGNPADVRAIEADEVL